MKPKRPLIWIIACALGSIAQSHAQRDVFSRSDAGTGLWWSNSNNPWFYQGSGTNPQNRPDNNSASTTLHNVFIGHNNNTTMTVNGAFFGLRTLTLQSTASTNRTFNASDGGGISLSVGFTNASVGSHTFNVPIGIDGATVTLNASHASGITGFTGNFFVNSNIAEFTGPGEFSVTGTMSGTGGSVVKSGSGVLSITAGNSYTGGTTLNGGTLRIGGGTNVLGTGTLLVTGADAKTFSSVSGTSRTFNNAINLYGDLTLGQSSGGTGSINMTGNVQLGAEVDQTRTLTVIGSHSFSGQISGNRGITKEGAGTLTLSGGNTYVGTTFVDDGTLLVNGSQAGEVSVASGSTLGGTGVIAGAVNVTGVLSPGASIESLGTGTLTFASGSSYAYEFNSGTVAADLSHITGDLNIGSNVGFDLTDEVTSNTLAIGTKFTLFSYSGNWNSGTFTGYDDNSSFTLGENQWRILYADDFGGSNFFADQSGAAGFVTLTVIPEASAAALGGLGMLVLLRRRRE